MEGQRASLLQLEGSNGREDALDEEAALRALRAEGQLAVAFQAGNVFVPKPTVLEGGVRKADGPLVCMLLTSERGTLFPAPR